MQNTLLAIGWQIPYDDMQQLRAVCRITSRVSLLAQSDYSMIRLLTQSDYSIIRPHCRYYNIIVMMSNVARGEIPVASLRIASTSSIYMYTPHSRRYDYATVSRCDCGEINLIIHTDPTTRARREAYIDCCPMSKCTMQYEDSWNGSRHGYYMLDTFLCIYQRGAIIH